ncbi:MAG: Gfo/Idh/MocA family oxidoreductase, partial [Lentisphaerae bacterium]|nr:Gfo/Idh/MocA family oxidoreductase [Lentisphaerota bacterium]
MANFALIGAAGFVAPRHMRAIRETGNRLVAASDPHDSVGVIDSYFPEARFFTEIERFDRHLEKLRRRSDEERAHYISICSPNYLHDAHVRLALRLGAHAVCEKPLVINPWNLDQLAELEQEHGARVYTVLQLRHLPALRTLKTQIEKGALTGRADVVLTYITRRGAWYGISWKGAEEKSGGLAMNIGIHFFDLVLWLFGEAEASAVHVRQTDKMAGVLELERARVRWFLSVDEGDLPDAVRRDGRHACRSLCVDGEEIEFSSGFEALHTRVYEGVLAGTGPGIAEARPSIQLVYDIRRAEMTAPGR